MKLIGVNDLLAAARLVSESESPEECGLDADGIAQFLARGTWVYSDTGKEAGYKHNPETLEAMTIGIAVGILAARLQEFNSDETPFDPV